MTPITHQEGFYCRVFSFRYLGHKEDEDHQEKYQNGKDPDHKPPV